MMTRRSLIFLPAAIAIGQQAEPGSPHHTSWKFGEDIVQGDTTIRLMEYPEGSDFLVFSVGVRTQVTGADQASVRVFYETSDNFTGTPTKVLRSQVMLAPLDGSKGSDLFTIPRDSLRFIRVTLLRSVATTEFH